MRTLDLTALRSFVTVAAAGGVTRAAERLHLTQSAVSMQLKRLEEALGQKLLARQGRGVVLTAQGELLASYAQRMLALNDEAWGRLTADAWQGEVRFGVPHDIVFPHIPGVLRAFAAAHPRVHVALEASTTAQLLDGLARGRQDLVLTTEVDVPDDAERLATLPLVFVGARGGSAWQRRPLRLAFERDCRFRAAALAALDAADIPWELADCISFRSAEAETAADLALNVLIEGTWQRDLVAVEHGGALPDLPAFHINLYQGAKDPAAAALAEMVRSAYRLPARLAAE